nr:class I SAM-dependent methyltransferase [Pseudogemmobacter hezensis]
MAALGRPGPAPDSAICEIGCGQGFGLCLLAAANPGRQFIGIDLSGAAIAQARHRARAADLQNIDFICADIRDSAALPDQDFGIILNHGMLSWVEPPAREALFAFIGTHLAAGGVAQTQYMSAPGGEAFRPFRQLFQTLAGRADPVADGLALLRQLRDGGAGFFQLHPHASQTLDNLLREPAGYVAQEYLSPAFDPLPFASLADYATRHGLEFVGSATPMENIDAISLPEGLKSAIAASADDLILTETLKDLVRNQAARYDLWQRPAAALAPQDHMRALADMWWGLLPAAPKLDAASKALAFPTRIGTIEGDPAIFRPLLDRLGEGPARFDQLMELAVFDKRPGLLNQVLQMGLHARILHPVQGFDTPEAAARLNRHLLAEAKAGLEIPALAAPPLGSGLVVAGGDLQTLAAGTAPAWLRGLFALGST